MPRIPKYRNKNSYGHCRIKGHDYYLGPWQKKPPEEYWNLIAKHMTGTLPKRVRVTSSRAPSPTPGMSIAELIDEYLTEHVTTYYRDSNGQATTEQTSIRGALRVVFEKYCDLSAEEFSARHVIELQQHMINVLDLHRRYINHSIARIKAMFRWALEREKIQGANVPKVLVVRSLIKNRSNARESKPVRGVPADVRAAVLARCPDVIADMAIVHEDCGARGQEICSMRWSEINQSGDVWIYTPSHHKNAWRDQSRRLYIEKTGQLILEKYRDRPADEPIFSPAASEAKRRARVHEQRKTPLNQGNRPGTNCKRRPITSPGDAYTTESYRRALRRGGELAFPFARIQEVKNAIKKYQVGGITLKLAGRRAARAHPELFQEYNSWKERYWWTPHRLRHTAAKRYEKEGGLEYKMYRLGHRTISTSLHYDGVDENDTLKKIQEIRARLSA